MPDRLLLSADDKTEEEEADESMTVVCVDDNIPSQSMSVDDSIINTTQHTVEGWSATHNNFFSQQMGMCHFGVRGFANHQTTRGVVLFHVEVHCGTTCIHNDARQNLLDLYNQPMDGTQQQRRRRRQTAMQGKKTLLTIANCHLCKVRSDTPQKRDYSSVKWFST